VFCALRPTAIIALLCALLGCETSARDDNTAKPNTKAEPETIDEPAVAAPRVESLDLLSLLRYCEVRHRGVSIDVGSSWSESHRSFAIGPFSDVKPAERAGHFSGRVQATRLEYDFWLDRPTSAVRISMQVQGQRSRTVTLALDEQRVGEARVSTEASRVLEFGPIARELAPGRHVLGLTFARGRGQPSDPLALLDWLRVYLPDNIDAQYAAPTRANILQDVELGNQPRRSLALRSPGSVRCPLLPGAGARLRLDVGYLGEGEATIELLAHLGYQKTLSLAERRVSGGDDAKWSHLDLALDALTSELVALEFLVRDGKGSGRAVFGKPELARTLTEPPAPLAKNVVLVVGSGLARELIPPWGERKGLSQLFALSEEGTVFDGYRVPSMLVGGVFASLLTGVPGSTHGLTHPAAKIAEGTPLLSRLLREAGGSAALFTNVPYTFEAFGFNRDWNRFESFSPVEDLAADEPLVRANRWLSKELLENPEQRRLLVVHLRSAHPPFDVTPEDAAKLAPSEYNGFIEPRRAAIILKQVRERERSSGRKLGPRDWERLVALQRVALERQDAALGALLETLKQHQQWQDSLVVFMGDVARGDAPAVPFEPLGELREDRLSPPLLIKLPGPAQRSRRVVTPLTTLDVAHALYEGLGLRFPGERSALDLNALRTGTMPLHSEGILAVHPPNYAFTVGRFSLSGVLGETPRLCDLEVDPACQQDLYSQAPFQVEWLWRLALRAFESQAVTDVENARSLAKIDDETRAALSVFGL
jgi:hypothetical protein